ncbi:hypothetical protein RM780_05760 [Streptomyces sp. DSM 44917]|uniref:Permease n=1 Tax=Streptomyces boetiae TaxID=3075541 RepID=A0ABU2L4H7_9ACTN|nr:hypothetical protein [Streptomyces sp. DSM 44917]MDT0306464.1 hypothetical protein [Streptomyces sp. DSM 44917]
MDVDITSVHWIYLAGIVLIIACMLRRKNVVIPSVLATLLTATFFSHSLITGIAAVFNASLTAAKELFSVFLIIALVTAMLGALRELGADRLMVLPFRRLMRGGIVSFLVLAAVSYVMALFFLPTPSVPLLGAILIPVAIQSGLPPMTVGLVVAITGQGMALSSGMVLRFLPEISASAAGADVDTVANRAFVMSLLTGVTALVITYVMQRRKFQEPSDALLEAWESRVSDTGAFGGTRGGGEAKHGTARGGEAGGGAGPGRRTPPGGAGPGAEQAGAAESGGPEPEGGGVAVAAPPAPVLAPQRPAAARTFAILVPVAYLCLILYLALESFTDVVGHPEGLDAAALVGGVATLILFAAAMTNDRGDSLETASGHLIDGLLFAFKTMGVVIPIAGFFYLGNGGYAPGILGMPEDAEGGPSLIFDLATAAQSHLPENGPVLAFAILAVGLVAGLEGAGFVGLPLTGSLSAAFGPGVGMDPATLAAIGQMGNVWSGGGTLVAWSSLIAVAGFARVSVFELARQCFIPVMAGLIVSTTVSLFIF